MPRATIAIPRKVAVKPSRELRAGELRRQIHLDSEAVYRVCGWDEQRVEVEVVRAPGLTPGQRFQFAREAVAQMTVVADPDDGAPAPPGG